MVDGEEQRERDRVFLSQLGKEIEGRFPSRWYVCCCVYWIALIELGLVRLYNLGCMGGLVMGTGCVSEGDGLTFGVQVRCLSRGGDGAGGLSSGSLMNRRNVC